MKPRLTLKGQPDRRHLNPSFSPEPAMKKTSKLTRLELEAAYLNASRERDCWELVWRFQTPDFSLSVRREAPTLVTETWYLHASHRASGPVLRVVAADGTESVCFLMHAGVLQPGQLFAFAPEQDPYRTSALHKCQRFANEVANGLRGPSSAPAGDSPPDSEARQPPMRARTSCSCEKPCATFEEHVCKLSQALAVHKTTCEHCRSRRQS